MPFLVRQNDRIKGTSDTWMAERRWQRRYHRRTHRNDPYRRVKGRYCGIGLGRFVTCRRHLSVSRRHAMAGLHIPVPGVSRRAVRPPDNTAHRYMNR